MKMLLLFGALSFCALFGGEQVRQADAATLLPYGTNLGRVVDLEINYFPDRTQLQIAATTDTRFVKRGEYRSDTAIQNVLQLVRFKERGKLFVVYEDNRIISFFVQD
jgi:hypothetical protein